MAQVWDLGALRWRSRRSGTRRLVGLVAAVVVLGAGCTRPGTTGSPGGTGPAGTALPSTPGSLVAPAPTTSAPATSAPAVTTPAATTPAVPAADGAPTISLTGAPVGRGRVRGPAPLDNLLQDQGIPVTLPDGRILWIFADTANLFSEPSMFQTSSAALSDAASPNQLRFVVDSSGRPAEFLPRRGDELITDPNTYTGVWPMGATTLPDGRILISYSKYRLHLSPVSYTFLSSGLFEYRYPGYDFLTAPLSAQRIADDMWGPEDGPINTPVYKDGYVYFMTCPGWICYSLRTTPESLTDRASYRWWTGSDWSPQRENRKALSFGGSDVPGTNPSLQWVPRLGAYAMVDTSVGAADTSALVWLARQPQGPWSAPVKFPLANCGVRGCYLPNIQPQSSTATSLRIAYASGGTWGPTMWTLDLPVRADTRARTTTYPAPKPVADTTTGYGVLEAGPLEQNASRHVLVSQPDEPTDLTAVTVAVTVTATSAGRLRLGPSGAADTTSVIDYTATGPTTKTVVVPVGPNHRIAVTNDGPPADVSVSVVGYSAGG